MLLREEAGNYFGRSIVVGHVKGGETGLDVGRRRRFVTGRSMERDAAPEKPPGMRLANADVPRSFTECVST